MLINGKLFTVDFKAWVHKGREGNDNVIGIGSDNLRAHFEKSSWSPEKGKLSLGEIYHTVESLLDFEECLTCDAHKLSFPDELEQAVKALKSYPGKKDIAPLPHSKHDEDSGFYAREM